MAQNTWSTSLTAVLYVILVQFFTPIVLHTNSAIRNYPNGRYSVISWHVMPVVNFGDGNSSTARKPGTRQDKLPCFGCRTSPRGRVLGWCNRHSIASNVKSRTWRSTVGACAHVKDAPPRAHVIAGCARVQRVACLFQPATILNTSCMNCGLFSSAVRRGSVNDRGWCTFGCL